MNKLTALITTAILGISSAAIAKPAAPTQVADADHDRNGDRFHDRGRSHDQVRYDRDRHESRWLNLGVARTGRTTIEVGGPEVFRSLRLDVNGWLHVNQVIVRFANGTQRLVRLQQANISNSDPLVIDLGASRRVTSVTVFASRYGRGSVQVSGLKTRGYSNRG